MNRLLRPTVVAALAAAGTLGATQTARAEVEIGGTAGIHVFSETNELGVEDVTNAPSQRNSALFGVRLGVFFGPLIGVEGEFGVVPSESRSLVFDIWNVTYRGHLVAQFRAAEPKNKLVPFVLFGGGAFAVVDSKNEDEIAKDTDALLYAPDRIRVNSVHPGYIRTPMVEQHLRDSGAADLEAAIAEVGNLHPLGHMGDADDIAWGVVYLASDEAKFVTGTELVIDGGYTAR